MTPPYLDELIAFHACIETYEQYQIEDAIEYIEHQRNKIFAELMKQQINDR